MTRTITAGGVAIGGKNPLALIAGPCVVESREIVFRTAEHLVAICRKLGVPLIFKSSYEKANRTSVGGFRGIGMETALRILGEVKQEFGIPLVTDIHSPLEAPIAAEVVDMLQIPAFLCRQTDLLLAAGATRKAVNIKKGQFLAPEAMAHAAAKVESTGNLNVLLCERGSFFGYHDLVVDMRNLAIMRGFGYPVVMDATHAVQIPSLDKQSGGRPEYIAPIARAAAAVGIDVLFIETHPDPLKALSDAESQLPLDRVETLLTDVLAIDRIVRASSERTE